MSVVFLRGGVKTHWDQGSYLQVFVFVFVFNEVHPVNFFLSWIVFLALYLKSHYQIQGHLETLSSLLSLEVL